MNQKIFRKTVDHLWNIYVKISSILGVFENIGFLVEDDTNKKGPTELYSIESEAINAIVDMVYPEVKIKDKNVLDDVVAKMENFRMDVLRFMDDNAEKISNDSHSKDVLYEEFLQLLRTYGIEIPDSIVPEQNMPSTPW